MASFGGIGDVVGGKLAMGVGGGFECWESVGGWRRCCGGGIVGW
jgi:hypothetical protein